MGNSIWVFLATTIQESPWRMVLICLALLTIPPALIPVSKAPALARLGKRFPALGAAAGLFAGAGIALYYWTVGAAAMLLLIITFVASAGPLFKDLLF